MGLVTDACLSEEKRRSFSVLDTHTRAHHCSVQPDVETFFRTGDFKFDSGLCNGCVDDV